MKPYFVAATLVLCAGTMRAGEPEAEKLTKQYVKLFQETAQLLKKIESPTDAKTALPRLEDLGKQLLDNATAYSKLKLQKDVEARLKARYGQEFHALQEEIKKEVRRLMDRSAIKAILGKVWVKDCQKEIGPIDAVRMGRAQSDVKKLEKAVMDFRITYGRYPNELQELTVRAPDGGKAVLKAEDLIDPWGRPFVVNFMTIHPNTDVPLIYSRGPSEKDGPVIRNWNPDEP